MYRRIWGVPRSLNGAVCVEFARALGEYLSELHRENDIKDSDVKIAILIIAWVVWSLVPPNFRWTSYFHVWWCGDDA
jgi:hypothetical protein